MRPQIHTVQTSDQQSLCVKTWGNENNPALVLVHGYPDNQEVWEPMISELINDFYIVTYDVRGAGQSSIPQHIRDYRLKQLSLDLEVVVNQILGDRPFHLAAHDWGSIQTWESVTEPKFKDRILSYTTISGPCLDHAAWLLRDEVKNNPADFLKKLSKSWYIGAFHLPFIAPTVWHFFTPQKWGKILDGLEKKQNLPLNPHISSDGRYGINLYRANFISALTKPRQRYAQCPVQAVVLMRDAFVSPDYILKEMPKWVEQFEYVEVDANHWAILSEPQKVANYIRQFALSRKAA
ncbi:MULTISPECIES: alpha/beta fold hydrolase [unclassified Acinetobacter]|uniref:alpha/beta fold hydrolase n=1 Tax=unclassified Acinetobacter TaxID=196816 RepID=UPI0019096733|nr:MULTISPECIES: alpha/beta fold hydrolase [unclassified Acinetobacter]MBK0064805.1 alpha/beta fold hydrolase [Acinetobacter sp. S55]MBK0068168.1 alpha/beta fold hydrolase [Acinetobacter sp. S54]